MVAIRDYSEWSNKLADSQPKHQRGDDGAKELN